MRIAVAGSREATEEHRIIIIETMEYVNIHYGINCLIHGGAPGVDMMAREWAKSHGILTQTYHADWEGYGRGAGPLRNQAMVDSGIDYWIAFPKGESPGTRDFIKRAVWARIPGQIVDL